jgi:DNA primase catalytic core
MTIPVEVIAQLNADATAFFHDAYLANPEMRDYVRSRGISDESAEHWRLGYAPKGNDMRRRFEDAGWGATALVDASLLATGADGSMYAFFRDRLMFPIPDLDQTRIAGFSSRVWRDGQTGGKYVNSAATELYAKHRVLYGWTNEADIRSAGEVYVVEGNFDMIALWQAGIRNVVATCGTAFTLDQLHILGEMAPRITLVFDSDTGGERATSSALLLAGVEDYDVGVIRIDGGKDPAEIMRSDPSAWAGFVASRVSRWEHLWNVTLAPYAETVATDVEARIAWKNEWSALVRKISPPRELAERLLRRCEARIGLPRGGLAVEYLPVLDVPSVAEHDELVLLALADDWERLRAVAHLISLGRAGQAVLSRWIAAGKPDLDARLTHRRERTPEAIGSTFLTVFERQLRPKIAARLAALSSSMPDDDAGMLAAVREANALTELLRAGALPHQAVSRSR